MQQALLKMLEGRSVQVPAASTSQWTRHENVTLDTTHVLFICAGTFTDLYDHRRAVKTVGFGEGAKPQAQSVPATQATSPSCAASHRRSSAAAGPAARLARARSRTMIGGTAHSHAPEPSAGRLRRR